jgi:Golgi apparatus protein 1
MFAVSGPVLAQSSRVSPVLEELTARIKNLENACGEDIKKYCSTVTPGEGRIVYCMQAHEDKISAKCGYNLDEVLIDFEEIMAGLTKAIQACQPDIEKLCGKTEPGQGRIAACLAANKTSIAQDCSQAIEKIQVK